MARDLAIDLGTANTLVYVRGRGHRPQRAVGHRPQQPEPGRPGRGHRGVADDRPHARPHRGRAPAAGRGHHRLRRHPAHDPAGPGAGRACPASTAPGSSSACRRPSPTSSAGPSPRPPAGPAPRSASSSSSPWPPPSAPSCPINEPMGSMVVDIGGGTSESAILSLGGIVSLKAVRVGSFDFDAAIQTHIRKEHGIAIGEQTAEKIKIAMGSAYPTERGVPGRGPGPRADVGPAQDRGAGARGDPRRPRGADHHDHRLDRGLPRRGARPTWPRT